MRRQSQGNRNAWKVCLAKWRRPWQNLGRSNLHCFLQPADFAFGNLNSPLAPPATLQVIDREWLSANLEFPGLGFRKPRIERRATDPQGCGGGIGRKQIRQHERADPIRNSHHFNDRR